jgi:SAM-dependent methyltransferase
VFKWPFRRAAPAVSQSAHGDPNRATLSFRKFHDIAPSAQAAIDLFKGHWASRFPDLDPPVIAGDAPLFTVDHRPGQAAAAFGGGSGRLDGSRVVELGPLEGGHTYQLERLGAEVIAIEGNAEAYLKCLIVKEVLGMRAKFLLGDFGRYLDGVERPFDVVFASGVLYHMEEPLRLIERICRAGDNAFLWTHYYDPERCQGFQGAVIAHGGVSVEHFRKGYGDQSHGRFWGGLDDAACWLPRDEIVRAFKAFGHTNVDVLEANPDHPHGPCFTIATSR